MNLKNKTLALVVAAALATPSAFAVEGSDGMHYTSASEGFYASIRVRFNSGGSDKDNAVIQNSSSRLGIQGTGEMSHGLEGFYRYEGGFSTEQSSESRISTRLGYVGLRGGFGSFRVGSDWTDSYNWVHGITDIANVNSGSFNYTDDYVGRASNALHYRTPDFNGLQVGVRFDFDGDKEGNPLDIVDPASGEPAKGNPRYMLNMPSQDDGRTPLPSEDNDLDAWELSAKYAFSGFTVAGTYINRADYLTKAEMGTSGGLIVGDTEDKTAWAVSGSYGQDNWSVATWYGENNAGDYGYHQYNAPSAKAVAAELTQRPVEKKQDETVFSVAGKVDVGHSGVYVVHETKEDLLGRDDTSTAFGVEYRLNSKSKMWVEYAAKDYDSDEFEADGVTPNTDRADDFVTIGFRHDF